MTSIHRRYFRRGLGLLINTLLVYIIPKVRNRWTMQPFSEYPFGSRFITFPSGEWTKPSRKPLAECWAPLNRLMHRPLVSVAANTSESKSISISTNPCAEEGWWMLVRWNLNGCLSNTNDYRFSATGAVTSTTTKRTTHYGLIVAARWILMTNSMGLGCEPPRTIFNNHK